MQVTSNFFQAELQKNRGEVVITIRGETVGKITPDDLADAANKSGILGCAATCYPDRCTLTCSGKREILKEQIGELLSRL